MPAIFLTGGKSKIKHIVNTDIRFNQHRIQNTSARPCSVGHTGNVYRKFVHWRAMRSSLHSNKTCYWFLSSCTYALTDYFFCSTSNPLWTVYALIAFALVVIIIKLRYVNWNYVYCWYGLIKLKIYIMSAVATLAEFILQQSETRCNFLKLPAE